MTAIKEHIKKLEKESVNKLPDWFKRDIERKMENSLKNRSIKKFEEIEKITGLPYDYDPKDEGEPPASINNNEK